MTREEANLLLYLETCAVDYGGRANGLRMNEADHVIIERWKAANYIKFGRIKARDCNRDGNYWVRLSEEAWADATKYRRERAERMWNARRFQPTGPVMGGD